MKTLQELKEEILTEFADKYVFGKWVDVAASEISMFILSKLDLVASAALAAGEVEKSDEGGSISSNDCILMQFTGLNDKNGKEIYEGDLVKVQNGNPFAVVWWNGKCAFNIDSYACDYGCEVIGNIYENPEKVVAREK